jgi:hypothetical protein
MSLQLFTVTTEGSTDALAFTSAQETGALAGRTHFLLVDPTTFFPSDLHARRRAEDYFGVQPQEGPSPAGAGMNTVFALRIHAPVGTRRLMFFGLRRI